jgi:polyphosphate kinase
VHVVYGLVGLKTHAKTSLVVRHEPDGIRRYCHIGTGNYNERTARTYEDLGLLTCDPAIGADLSQLFNYLTGFARQERYRKLLVAPGALRPRLIELIEREAIQHHEGGPGGRIVLKMNSLVDVELIDALYAASQAGVEIDLIVRGICCLRPGVPGLSEHIRVRSIIGRYLEHSRIYQFANGGGPGQPTYLIGSADLMPRNLDRRVEALVPIEDPQLQARLQQIIDLNLADDELAWELLPDGSWQKVPTTLGVSTHAALERAAAERVAPPSASSL